MKSKTTTVLSIGVTLLILLWATPGAAAAPLQNAPARAKDTVAAAGGSGIVSIPAAAFTPYVDGYDFVNDGSYLKHFRGPGGTLADGWYYAPVSLPQGATVTKMTFYYKVVNVTTWTATAKLQRTVLDTDNWSNMATIVTTGTGTQFTSDSTSSILNPTIDNSHNLYTVAWDLPWTSTSGNNDFWGCGVTIEYTPPATVSGVLSIPAAAFTPFEDGYDYENDGRFLFTTAGVTGAYGWYLAPVQLPQGATVTKMTFHWYDANAFFKGVARLQRTDLQGHYADMAYAESAGSGGYGSTYDDTISYATIDNSQYAYWVIWDIPVGSDLRGCAVVIEYTLPTTGSNAGVISIPAASFKQHVDGYDYENDGRYLQYFHDENGMTSYGSFYAQAPLPQGATVTKVTYYYRDTFAGAGNGGGINLRRTQLGYGTDEYMTGIGISNMGQGYSSYSQDTIAYATIDNSQYAYWVVLKNLPVSDGGSDWLCGVVIEYTYYTDLPMILR